jgi:hypothetical protein
MRPSTGPDEAELDSPRVITSPFEVLVRSGESEVVSIAVIPSSAAGRNRGQSSPARDIRIDTLRGLFLVLMMVDHLPVHPLLCFTQQSVGFVSAAEGFVFVSGVVSAWVYGRILVKQGKAVLRRRAWCRARDIYFTHLSLYTLALVGGWCGAKQIANQFPNFWQGWWHGAALVYQPPLFGILPMYALFLFVTPWLLGEMAKGKAVLVWAASISLWLAAQWGIGSRSLNPRWLQLGTFNILAWQLLFVAGAYLGYRKVEGRRSIIPHSRALFVFSVVLAALFFLVRHQNIFFKNIPFGNLEIALGAWKASNHPLRLVNFAALAYCFWYLPRWVDEKVEGLTVFRLFRYLGGHSLQVFGWSIFVSYMALTFNDSWVLLPAVWRALLAVTAALSLVIPAWAHERWKLSAVSKSERLVVDSA